LKERMFGLTGAQANHGEDVKEYWWYLDATPSHCWNRWRYHYPQSAFPYERLVDENAARSKLDPEFELMDTGIFDDARIDTEHPFLGPLEIAADDGPDGSPPDLLFCDNETNAERLFGTAGL